MKIRVQIWIAFAMCAFGCALLGLGLMLPPKGEIDSSVLVAYGETLTFAGAVIGIDWSYRSRIRNGFSSAESGDSDLSSPQKLVPSFRGPRKKKKEQLTHDKDGKDKLDS